MQGSPRVDVAAEIVILYVSGSVLGPKRHFVSREGIPTFGALLLNGIHHVWV